MTSSCQHTLHAAQNLILSLCVLTSADLAAVGADKCPSIKCQHKIEESSSVLTSADHFLQSGFLNQVPFDPLSLRNDDMREKEIKNGRLAMVAFLGFASQAAVQGKGPIASLQYHLADPFKHNSKPSLSWLTPKYSRLLCKSGLEQWF